MISFSIKKCSKYFLLLLILNIAFLQGLVAQTAPTGVSSRVYQREIEIYWTAAPNTDSMEVVVLNKADDTHTTYFTTRSNHFITGFAPGTSYDYEISLRAISGTDYSSSKTLYLEGTTRSMMRSANDSLRLPYIRTIEPSGIGYIELPLFWYEIATADAVITYKVNGTPYTPIDGYYMRFPSDGRYDIEAAIDEGNGRKWTIYYSLSVRSINKIYTKPDDIY